MSTLVSALVTLGFVAASLSVLAFVFDRRKPRKWRGDQDTR